MENLNLYKLCADIQQELNKIEKEKCFSQTPACYLWGNRWIVEWKEFWSKVWIAYWKEFWSKMPVSCAGWASAKKTAKGTKLNVLNHAWCTSKLYIPSTLNIDLILCHTQLIVCAENVKSWVFPFTFQAYTLPQTLNCMCVSLFKFHIWILEQF